MAYVLPCKVFARCFTRPPGNLGTPLFHLLARSNPIAPATKHLSSILLFEKAWYPKKVIVSMSFHVNSVLCHSDVVRNSPIIGSLLRRIPIYLIRRLRPRASDGRRTTTRINRRGNSKTVSAENAHNDFYSLNPLAIERTRRHRPKRVPTLNEASNMAATPH